MPLIVRTVSSDPAFLFAAMWPVYHAKGFPVSEPRHGDGSARQSRTVRARVGAAELVVIAAVLLVSLPSCWPGKCGGAIRGVNPQERVLAPTTHLWLNVDTNAKD